MLKLLLMAAAAWFIWKLLTGVRVNITRTGPGVAPPREEYEAMARCAKCGVYLPASALSKSGLCGKCASP